MVHSQDTARRANVSAVAVALSIALTALAHAQAPAQPDDSGTSATGLAVTLTSDDRAASDAMVLPNVWLYVRSGESPSPFLPARPFAAVWRGSVAVDSRADFQFQAEANGDLKLELNGVTALETNGLDGVTAPSRVVRLNRGTNALTVSFHSPARGDAFLRLWWFNKETVRQPIPLAALTHVTTGPLAQAYQRHHGRELFLEFRCARCHIGPETNTAIPELAMDSPAFEDLGARRRFTWIARWIVDPRALQPAAVMPRVLHGPNAPDEARAIAAFLASLGSSPTPKAAPPSPPTEEQVLAGKKLFDSLHCIACHNALDSPDPDSKKISLKFVRAKFAKGALTAFLLKPEAEFSWIRMPHFQLSETEASALAAYLNARADPATEEAAPADPVLVNRGKTLVQTRGCLNCHDLRLENQFRAPALAHLSAGGWDRGCLASAPAKGTPAPEFGFAASELEALRAFGATDHASLTRNVPSEIAERQIRRLRCGECHGKFDGFPPLDRLGDKLKPEWIAELLAGRVAYNPRPWLEARMPAFPRWAEPLARGMALGHGYPPQTPAEPAVDPEAAAVGRKLVSAAGGFSCVACHAVGNVPAMQAADSPGINLVYAHQRLRRSYFERWLRQPQQIDPGTKMPAFFDEDDRSPLADVYGGDGAKQRAALWQYLRLGDQMPPPPTP